MGHVGWLLIKKDPDVVRAGRELDHGDLQADSFVMFQKRLDPWFTLFMCYLFPGYVAQYSWGANFWPAVWVAGALRYCLVLHFTWCVNSAAHLYGDHPYDPKSWPAENPFVCVLSVRAGTIGTTSIPSIMQHRSMDRTANSIRRKCLLISSQCSALSLSASALRVPGCVSVRCA